MLCKQKDGRSEDAPSDFAEESLCLALTISRADHPLVHLQCQRQRRAGAGAGDGETSTSIYAVCVCFAICTQARDRSAFVHSMTSVLHHFDLPPSHDRPVSNGCYFFIVNPVHRASVTPMHDRITQYTASYSLIHVSG